VLRLFGAKREAAHRHFDRYVSQAANDREYTEFELAEDGRILGSEEFVDATIHRVGETGKAQRPTDGRLSQMPTDFDGEALISAVESVCRMTSEEFCSSLRSARSTAVKEALIVAGRQLGATVTELAKLTGINSSNISPRYAAAMSRRQPQSELYDPVARIVDAYAERKR
jgi:hypothetical protein